MLIGDLTTLTSVRRSMKAAGIDLSEDDDEFLKRAITQASGLIASHTRRVFVPYAQTRLYDAAGAHVGPYHLDTDEDLLAITTLTNGDGTTIASSAYVLRPNNSSPKYRIQLKHSAGINFTWSTDWEAAISVSGIWGYHPDYANAWGTTGEVVPVSNLTNSATTLTQTDVDGLDSAGRVRFEVGMYLKIDSEVLKVTSTNTVNNTLQFLRAQLGTTAAAHTNPAIIYNYRPVPDIELLCIRLVVWLYQHRDVREGTIQLLESAITLSDNTLTDILAKLNAYRKTSITVMD